MKKYQGEIRGGRRAFFRAVAGVGVLAGTGALILRAGGGSGTAAKTTAAAAPTGIGYHETDHIRKYYETARQ